MSRRRTRVAWLAVTALAVSACDSGPSGPGTLSATVESATPVGAVVLEVVGPAVEGFEAQGSTHVYGTAVAAAAGRHRAVVVAPDGAALRFGIRVSDLGAEPPAVTAVAAASPLNLPALATGIQVLVSR